MRSQYRRYKRVETACTVLYKLLILIKTFPSLRSLRYASTRRFTQTQRENIALRRKLARDALFQRYPSDRREGSFDESARDTRGISSATRSRLDGIPFREPAAGHFGFSQAWSASSSSRNRPRKPTSGGITRPRAAIRARADMTSGRAGS